MIGSGVYLLPASLGAFGSISLLGWLGAVAVAMVLALQFAWLGIIRPESGGFLETIGEAFGPATASSPACSTGRRGRAAMSRSGSR